jgi:putative ABC transport system substrate-binding protein
MPTVDAVLGVPGGSTAAHAGAIIRAATAARRPSVFPGPSPATAEALATYGASDVATARQAARLVEKILRGAPAGDLPVERPAKLELVLNLTTARALGLAIPGEVRLRADRVIE